MIEILVTDGNELRKVCLSEIEKGKRYFCVFKSGGVTYIVFGKKDRFKYDHQKALINYFDKYLSEKFNYNTDYFYISFSGIFINKERRSVDILGKLVDEENASILFFLLKDEIEELLVNNDNCLIKNSSGVI